MLSAVHVSDQLDEAVSGLTSGKLKSRWPHKSYSYCDTAQKPSGKQGRLQEEPYVESICEYAYQNGLSALTLRRLLDIITSPKHLSPTSCVKLLKSLYPACKISPDLVCILVSSLGNGQAKPPPYVQSLLLKWLMMVYELLEDPAILSQLYSVLFNSIDMSSIRYWVSLWSEEEDSLTFSAPAQICASFLLSSREEIMSSNLESNFYLSISAGSDPSLAALKQIFASYRSDAPFGRLAKGRLSAFSPADTAWRERLQVLLDKRGIVDRKINTESSSFGAIRFGYKQITMLYDRAIAGGPEDESLRDLETIDGVNDLIDNLESIYISPRIVSAIDDPLLQRYVGLDLSDEVKIQTDEWLSSFFDKQLQKTDEKKLADVLLKVLSYTRYTKTLPDPAEVFFASYLPLWNGKDGRSTILSLLSHVAIRPFEDIQSSLLNSLESAILDNTSESAIALLEFYTLLLRHWTAHHLSTSPPEPFSSALTSLTNHTIILTLTLLTSHPSSVIGLSATLSLDEALTHLYTYSPRLMTTQLPLTTYLQIFLKPSLPALSRLSSILATQKKSLENLPPASLPAVATLNSFIMDICNLLFRSRAFKTTDANALGCLLPASITTFLESYLVAISPTYHLSDLFSMSYNPALAALSTSAFRELEEAEIFGSSNKRIRRSSSEDHHRHRQQRDEVEQHDSKEGGIIIRHPPGPVSQRTLAMLAEEGGIVMGWKEYRLEVTDWLAERGVEGLSELIGCTMKGLKRKGGRDGEGSSHG